MPVDRPTLARLYAGEQGRAWDRIEREGPSTYWEENVVGGRRLARRTIVHWLEPLTKQTVLDAGCGFGSLGAHLAGLGAKVLGIDLLPRFRGCAARQGAALRDRRPPLAGLSARHLHHGDPRRGPRGLSARGTGRAASARSPSGARDG